MQTRGDRRHIYTENASVEDSSGDEATDTEVGGQGHAASLVEVGGPIRVLEDEPPQVDPRKVFAAGRLEEEDNGNGGDGYEEEESEYEDEEEEETEQELETTMTAAFEQS